MCCCCCFLCGFWVILMRGIVLRLELWVISNNKKKFMGLVILCFNSFSGIGIRFYSRDILMLVFFGLLFVVVLLFEWKIILCYLMVVVLWGSWGWLFLCFWVGWSCLFVLDYKFLRFGDWVFFVFGVCKCVINFWLFVLLCCWWIGGREVGFVDYGIVLV